MKDIKRLYWSDLLRIIAIFSVIVQHYCPLFFERKASIDLLGWNVANVYDCLANWSVPVFIMISGMFFLNPDKSFSTKSFYLRNVLKIVVIIFVWGLFYEIIKQVLGFEQHTSFSGYFIPLFFKRLPWYHLWFMYLILALYMLVPVLRIYTAHATKRNLEYLLILFVLVSCIQTLDKLIPALHFNIVELSGYAGYFIAGHYFSKYHFSKRQAFFVYLLGLLSVVFRIVVCSEIWMKNGGSRIDVFDYLSPFIMVTSFAVFLFFKNNVSFKSVRVNKTITFVSSCVLGIYLLHGLCIAMLLRGGISPLFFNPVFSICVLSLLTFVLCFIVIVFIKKIPFISKYTV